MFQFKTPCFGIIDVMGKRISDKLLKHFTSVSGYDSNGKWLYASPIKVIIEAEINDVHGNWDGVSREFSLNILSVKTQSIKPIIEISL
jgi:hypothetical protein